MPSTTLTTAVTTILETATKTLTTTTTMNLPTNLFVGCGKAPTLSSGTYTTTVNGQQRQYIITLPSGYDQNKSYKLIFGYHWFGGDMQAVAGGSYYGVQPLASNSAIFDAQQGIDNGWANTNSQDITFNG